MATRWEITRAVRGSDLPAPGRLIMLTLADVAEVGTAEIPARFTPSLTILARETGLGKSTVKVHLASLEESGWIVRIRPDAKAQWNGERTRYRLALPESMDALGVGHDVAYLGQEPAQVGQDAAQGGPGDGPGVGQEMARPGPGDGLLETDHSDLDQISTDPSSSAKPPKAKPEPPREDVDRVCNYLAEWIVRNGSRRPAISTKWRTEARLLIDKDGRSLDEIRDVIAWSQRDRFWKANVLSMPKLREKYDQLRLAMQRDQPGHDLAIPGQSQQPSAPARPSTTDQRVAAGLALAAKFDAQEAR